MLHPIEKSIFILLVVVTLFSGWRNFRHLFRSIASGGEKLPSGFHPGRLLRSLWLFISQRSLFRSRPLATVMHVMVAWGFTLYLLVNIVDIAHAWPAVAPAVSQTAAARIYRSFTDIFSVLVLLSVGYFLVRRFLFKSERLRIRDDILMSARSRAGVRRDSAIVGLFIFFHVGFRFLGASFELAHRAPTDHSQIFATFLSGLWSGMAPEQLVFFIHLCWWLAIGLILLFIPYFPFSKHAHLFMAPINHYFRDGSHKAAVLAPIDLENEDIEQYGAALLEHLPQKSRLDAYSCIMCNRCQDGCPAYGSGKPLSPSALEVNKRHEMNSRLHPENGSDVPKELKSWLISDEGIWACTTCGYCEVICPVGNEPFQDLIHMRQNLVLMESDFPREAVTTFKNLENNGNPWGLSRQDRLKWAEDLDLPVFKNVKKAKYLYWVGCAGAYDDKAIRTSRAMVDILRKSGSDFAVLGTEESCTGDSARRLGNEYLFQMAAAENIETLNKYEFDVIITQCPHCFTTLKNDYPALGGQYTVLSHSEFISSLIREGKIHPENRDMQSYSYHDSCYLGRHNGVYSAPRQILNKVAGEFRELSRNHDSALCCGAGGGRMWLEEKTGDKINIQRATDVKDSGADILATACPFCNTMLSDGCKALDLKTEVRDIAVIMAAALK